MKIGVHTTTYNVFSMGYLVYLACVESWLKVADFVVVVDGGSTDGSMDILREWVGYDPRLVIVGDEKTEWSGGDTFPWLQAIINWCRGYDELDVDVSIYVDADVVADVSSMSHLREELAANQELIRKMRRFGFVNDTFVPRSRPNWNIVDRRIAARDGIQVGWGINSDTGGRCEMPIKVTGRGSYVDRILGTPRTYYLGTPLPIGGYISGRAGGFGHFFFTLNQCLAKCRRWDQATARLEGRRMLTNIEYRYQQNLFGIERYLSKDEMLALDHLPEMRRVIETFYRPGMLGGAIYRKNRNMVHALYTPPVYALKLWRTLLDRIRPVPRRID